MLPNDSINIEVAALDRFMTSNGELISIEIPDELISTGDLILVDNQKVVVKGIWFPTTPSQERVLLKIE